MYRNSKHEIFVNGLIENSPEFMIIEESNEKYLLFDRLVMSLDDNAMPWLVKVYLEQQYNILKNDKFTLDFRSKYDKLNPQLINLSGNIFFNKDGMLAIIIELEKVGQLKYDEKNRTFNLL